MDELPKFQEFTLLNMPGLGMHVGTVHCVCTHSPLLGILWKQVSSWCFNTSVSGNDPAGGNAKEAMGTCVICIYVFGPPKIFSFLHIFGNHLALASGTGVLSRMQWYWTLIFKPVSKIIFIVCPRKRKCFREICSSVKKGGSFLFFLVAIVSLIIQYPAFAQSIECQLPFPCGSGRSLSV